jgi:hypothetical protein
MMQWLQQQQPREFFVDGFHWLVHQWYACLSAHWNYF